MRVRLNLGDPSIPPPLVAEGGSVPKPDAVIRKLLDPTLRRIGVDLNRFWLLVWLFRQLSERREALGQLGRNRASLKLFSGIYAFLTLVLTFGLAAGAPSLPVYFASSLFLGGMLLASLLVGECNSSLINVEEGSMLAHQPIDGRTYTAAKLAHIGRLLLWFVPALNGFFAIGAAFVHGGSWYYVPLHFALAWTLAVVLTLGACGVFGLLLRFVEPSRLKRAGQIVEILPMGIWALNNSMPGFVRVIAAYVIRLQIDPYWALAAGLAITTTLVTLGLKSLSRDYLLRVSAISQGSSARRRKPMRSRIGAVVSTLLGGQPARAAYEFSSKMIRRDTQFRRVVFSLIPSTFMLVAAVGRSFKHSPFAPGFSAVHFAPHLCGLYLLTVTTSIAQGTEYKAAWLFQTVPPPLFRAYARGVHAAIWTAFALVPSLIALAAGLAAWPTLDAVLFAAFTLGVASFYLSILLNFIQAIPFTRKPAAGRQYMVIPIMFVGGIVVGVIVALQYFLLFRSTTAVAVGAGVFVATSVAISHFSLANFAGTMRHELATASGDGTELYREVE